jgi:hypothetical protein
MFAFAADDGDAPAFILECASVNYEADMGKTVINVKNTIKTMA